MDTLFIFFITRSFLDIVARKIKNRFFLIRELALLYIILNGAQFAKFQIYRLHLRDSDWLNLAHFSGYKNKIRLVLIL